MAELEITVPEVAGAIRNPGNSAHFMVVQPIEQRVQIYFGDAMLADTTQAKRIIEISHHAYEPRIYVPVSDVVASLVRTDKQTHCPLKGDAFYLTLNGEEVAWGYEPFDFASVLKDHLSFWGPNLKVIEG